MMVELTPHNTSPLHPKVTEALDVLRHLGFPRAQLNDRSALTLLALLGLGPDDSWKSATSPLCGITPMMKFFAKHYGKKYAPNSRETIRRYAVHQFVQAGFVLENPDKPDRPTNSGKTVYCISKDALILLRTYGMQSWNDNLTKYLKLHPQLKDIYVKKRTANAPIRFSPTPDITMQMSHGRHGDLLRAICTKFASQFVQDVCILYVGDTAKKFAFEDKVKLADLGITLDRHGKAPDVIMYDAARGWLFLVEAVTSHGPVDPKRKTELDKIFSITGLEIIYVTAFTNMNTMKKYAADISWETEVWIAESPDHMIHFNGEKFLGPAK